jgi:hypothetical protein
MNKLEIENATAYMFLIAAIIQLLVVIIPLRSKNRNKAIKKQIEEHAKAIELINVFWLLANLAIFIVIVVFNNFYLAMLCYYSSAIAYFISFQLERSAISRREILIIASYCIMIPLYTIVFFFIKFVDIATNVPK